MSKKRPVAAPVLQTVSELDEFYNVTDPWDYYANPEDRKRREMMMAMCPREGIARTLDIGCGNGFITRVLPGSEIIGLDISPKAIGWAREEEAKRQGSIRFEVGSVLDADMLAQFGKFDLVVMTGVLYPEYVGDSFGLVVTIINELLKPGAYLVHVHIDEWLKTGFPYRLIDSVIYEYRTYTHRLEVYKR